MNKTNETWDIETMLRTLRRFVWTLSPGRIKQI